MLVTLFTYTLVSLCIAMVLNWYNRRAALTGD
jgi:ABC-type amino acid transport system permease subunit